MSAMESKLVDDEDEVICEAGGTAEDQEFDSIVGALEEILFDGEFSTVQGAFCKRHCCKSCNKN